MVTENNLAIYVLNPQGYKVAKRIIRFYPAKVFAKHGVLSGDDINIFSSLRDIVKENFFLYRAHVFICATGIVVRVICPYICSKDRDPAVLVIDPRARFVISLLSGHLGGANSLAREMAEKIKATPVITTATDSFDLPAIDEIARELELKIDHIKKVKTLNSAILKRDPIWIYDPLDYLNMWRYFPKDYPLVHLKDIIDMPLDGIGVVCDFKEHVLDEKKILLYPRVLYVGVGCNTNTTVDEILAFLYELLSKEGISIHSIKAIVTTDKKNNERGIIEFANKLGVELIFVEHERLNQVDVPNPSKQVKKHMGVYSVCEAAAIIASRGRLIVEKRKTKNVTLAIAISS